jgi:hypothetical protein
MVENVNKYYTWSENTYSTVNTSLGTICRLQTTDEKA